MTGVSAVKNQAVHHHAVVAKGAIFAGRDVCQILPRAKAA
jgi:hypothetical protein